MPINDIIRNAINNLTAEKSNAYQRVFQEKLTEGQSEITQYDNELKEKLNAKIDELQKAYESAISSKRVEVENRAKYFAEVEQKKYDDEIEQLQKHIIEE